MDPSPDPPLYGREYDVLPMWPLSRLYCSPSLQGGMGWVLHATRRAKGGGDCREDGDYDVEDFAPSGVVVECSHRLGVSN